MNTAHNRSTNNNIPKVHIQGTTQYDVYGTSKNEEIAFLASLRATEMPHSAERKSIDVVCVCDVSGSMSGSKLNLMKQTLHLLLSSLQPKDSLSIITFGTTAQCDEPLKTVQDGRHAFQSAIDRMRTRGQTNLSQGLALGLEQCKRSQSKSKDAALLLFTDGHANQGETNPNILADVYARSVDGLSQSVTLSTFGFGNDHDPEFLSILAKQGDGMFYYVQSLDIMPVVFADALGGLSSIVARSLVLTLTGQTSSVYLSAPECGGAFQVDTITPGVQYKVHVRDMYASESRDFIVRAQLSPGSASHEMPLCLLTLEYENQKEQTTFQESMVSITRMEHPGERIADPEVTQHLLRLEAVEAMQRATDMGSRGQYQEAEQTLTGMLSKLKTTSLETPELNNNFAHVLETDLNDMAQAVSSKSSFHHGGAHKMKSAHRGYQMQRSNALNPLYQTKAQCEQVSSWKGKKMQAKNRYQNFNDA